MLTSQEYAAKAQRALNNLGTGTNAGVPALVFAQLSIAAATLEAVGKHPVQLQELAALSDQMPPLLGP